MFVGVHYPPILPHFTYQDAVLEQWYDLHRPIYQALALLSLNISLNVTSVAHRLPQSTLSLSRSSGQISLISKLLSIRLFIRPRRRHVRGRS